MKEIRDCLTGFRFKELFIEHLLWDSAKGAHAIQVKESLYELEAVADKKGLVALICHPKHGAQFPGSAERQRIEREVAKLHHEHLIVFVDNEQTRQIWQVPRHNRGKTTGHSEVPYFKGKGVEHLARRIEALSFTLDESENVSLIEVSTRVNQALLAERVTKKFFKEFSDQRKAFLTFLDWIEDESKRDWYCSVLLNRLMFIYFIAEKGFLPEGKTFLSRRLESNAKANGPDTFYTHFLLPLSFFGFGEPQGKRGKFEEEFNGVLYLNGGLFAVHSLERELGISKEAVEHATFPTGAMIPDAEFKKWFGYFDSWRWTLDEDKVENEGHISPHILGYIFEKYINQKQMGAYYTKEDITGYICRNTIIPRLFDMLAETGDKGKQAVHPLPIGPHPNLLNEGRGISGGEGIDRYVYSSVKQEEKLPTETDYELGQRRTRYDSILSDFDAEKIRGIDDFITYNLDIERLALDFVENIQDADVLHRFYFRGLQSITVLDPTCGSGAFLFAALGILYPLYNAALSRMRYLVGKSTGVEPDVVNWAGRLNFDDLDSGQGVFADYVGEESKVIQDMRAEVERINDHPSAEYFIKKSIIVNNLFGVDIMEEAVEICKLRLFLSLIATVERNDTKPNLGVEPLPDIDFNILAGNTLVGYASIADIDRLWHEVEIGTSTLAFEKDHTRLRDLCREYGEVLRVWRLQQLGEWPGALVAKEQVIRAAEQVRPELDEDLWRLYRTAGVATVKEKGKSRQQSHNEFKRSHVPFHWMLEFPSIEAVGGFDVIVGNPPFVELAKLGSDYRFVGFSTINCGNLCASILERAFHLASSGNRVGMVLPISTFATKRMANLQTIAARLSDTSWLSTYGIRPCKLFEGAEQRLTLALAKITAGPAEKHIRFTTKYHRWWKEERDHLFETLTYADVSQLMGKAKTLNIGSEKALNILKKLPASYLGELHVPTGTTLYWHRIPGYFIKALDFVPFFRSDRDGTKKSEDYKPFNVANEADADFFICTLSSSLFYWYWFSTSEGYHCGKHEVWDAPFSRTKLLSIQADLSRLRHELMADMKSHSTRRCRNQKTTVVEYDEFYVLHSKPILDQIDQALCKAYGFTEEEKTFVLNYDLKYRMGQTEVTDGD